MGTPVEKKPLFSFGKAASSPKTFNKKVVAKKAPVKKTFGKKAATPAAPVKKPGFFAKKAAAPAKPVAAKKTFAKKAAPKKEDGFQLRLPTFRFGKEKKTVASAVFDMDLYNYRVDPSNQYGSRKNKGLKLGTLSAKSYVPDGMTQREYTKTRFDDKAKKDASYQRNVAKQQVYTDFTAWYTKRGTDKKADWYSITNGHDMAKTKYDWSGGESGNEFASRKFSKEEKKIKKK